MALPTVQDCKDYLKIEHTAEDTMLTGMLAQVEALIEAEIGRPITILNRTFVLECQPSRFSRTKMIVPIYPVAVEDSSAGTADLTLTDADGTVLVEDTDYRLDTRTGVLTAIDSCFTNYPYTIVADVGLAAFAEYDDRIEPVISAWILDLVAERYQYRNPSASSETTGGGVQTSYMDTGLPPRVKQGLARWRMYHV